MLPYADSFLTDIAQSAHDGACFSGDVTDQFLTMLAMENMEHGDGDGDFGSLTRLDLDDELRVVLVILDLWVEADKGRTVEDHNLACLISHYADKFAVIGEGGSQKWWADWYTYDTEEKADAEMAQFAQRYSEYLGCEDCGHGHEDDPCVCAD